jgi:hypothetical protein
MFYAQHKDLQHGLAATIGSLYIVVYFPPTLYTALLDTRMAEVLDGGGAASIYLC